MVNFLEIALGHLLIITLYQCHCECSSNIEAYLFLLWLMVLQPILALRLHRPIHLYALLPIIGRKMNIPIESFNCFIKEI